MSSTPVPAADPSVLGRRRQATCIDCHKGIAHELPNMEGVEPGGRVPPELRGKEQAGLPAICGLRQFVEAHSW